jgi:hypothetical protein
VDDYEERVERLLRDAWPEELRLLVVMYVPLTERGVGVTSGEDGFDLVRLQFDKSFWYSSWRTVEPGTDVSALPGADIVSTEISRGDGRELETQVLDFSRTRVRISKLSVPISDQLGRALLDVFQRSAEAAKPEVKGANDEIIVDGYKFEVLAAKRSCVQLTNPPPGSPADRIAGVVRFLDSELPLWRPENRKEFEDNVTQMIPH